jgi:hypothetical protein
MSRNIGHKENYKKVGMHIKMSSKCLRKNSKQ